MAPPPLWTIRWDCFIPKRLSRFGQSAFSLRASQDWNNVSQHIKKKKKSVLTVAHPPQHLKLGSSPTRLANARTMTSFLAVCSPAIRDGWSLSCFNFKMCWWFSYFKFFVMCCDLRALIASYAAHFRRTEQALFVFFQPTTDFAECFFCAFFMLSLRFLLTAAFPRTTEGNYTPCLSPKRYQHPLFPSDKTMKSASNVWSGFRNFYQGSKVFQRQSNRIQTATRTMCNF